MKIIIVYHEKRRQLAKLQYDHLRSFYNGVIHYICDKCVAPVSEPYTIVTQEQYSRQVLWNALEEHTGLVCVLDCDRLIDPSFLQPVARRTAIYPKYLYYTKRPHVSFYDDLAIAKKEKLIDVYKEVCCAKVPTSGVTLFHIEDWRSYRSKNHFTGYGFGDVATFLDMQRAGIKFIPSNAPALHLHHDYDITQAEFIRQNKLNAKNLSILYDLPVGKSIRQLPSE
jgi:hypothetical protein